MSMAAWQRQVFKNSLRQWRGGGSIFFEDIEKVHKFDRILVFTSELP
jgi:hypothetical protein